MSEDFLLLLLSDSNLPLGGFHFSAGLESTTKHGFLPKQTVSSVPTPLEPFIRSSLQAHARSTLEFVAASHKLTAKHLLQPPSLSETVRGLIELDELYESMTSNHVTRRGSRTQGVGMLTIWQKAFRPPAFLPDRTEIESVGELMGRLKAAIREGGMMGHMPVCWGVLCASLGLTLDRTLHLHLYLHTRSILSSSVRLNQTGPYHAQTILLYTIQPMIEAELKLYHARPGMGGVSLSHGIPRTQQDADRLEEDERENGPMNCWPLGEILQGRHDVMHSRMFNT